MFTLKNIIFRTLCIAYQPIPDSSEDNFLWEFYWATRWSAFKGYRGGVDKDGKDFIRYWFPKWWARKINRGLEQYTEKEVRVT